MRTPQQRRNLIKLRDEVVKFIPDGELRMEYYFHECGTPSCAAGWASASGKFGEDRRGILDLWEALNVDNEEWLHMFCGDLPNDPSWIAANITDLIEADASI